nr:chemotaxis protein CheB [Umezawaea beigongshangensis]
MAHRTGQPQRRERAGCRAEPNRSAATGPGASAVSGDRAFALHFPVVALVASGGGLDALTRVLAPLRADLPAAVLVALHQSPDRTSHLARSWPAAPRCGCAPPPTTTSWPRGRCWWHPRPIT